MGQLRFEEGCVPGEKESFDTVDAIRAAGPDEDAAVPAETRLLRRLVLKLCMEAGPLIVFFVSYLAFGLWTATGTFIIAAITSVVMSSILQKKWPTLPLVSAGAILVLGGLTLLLQAETFIKIRPTLVNGLFGLVVLATRGSGQDLVRRVLSPELKLSEQGWLMLSLRTGLFLLLLAVLNEIVRLGYSTDVWVTFKVFAIIPLDIAFALAQIPLIRRHRAGAPYPRPGGTTS